MRTLFRMEKILILFLRIILFHVRSKHYKTCGLGDINLIAKESFIKFL